VNSQDLQEMLARIEERQASHAERYDRDREETQRQAADERQERNDWRTSVESKIDKLDEKFTPVLRDHQMIVRGGKWIAGILAATWALFKGWIFLKELK
jgi:hypothetical protein